MAYFDTPQKARIQGTLLLADHVKATYGITYTQADLAAVFGTSRAQISHVKRDSPRTFANNPLTSETRGRKRKFGPEDCQELINTIHQNLMPSSGLGRLK